MEYGLTRAVIGCSSILPISKEEYGELSEAQSALLRALFLEEKLDLVTEDWLEFENELLASTSRAMVYGDTDFAWFQTERNLLNRRLVNLLSVCRAHLDYLRSVGQEYVGDDSDHITKFKACFCNCYDDFLGYRVMEAMRNFVQHRGFPIHALSFPSHLIESEPRNRFSYTAAIFTKVSYLREGGKFKAEVLAELEALGGRVDLKPLVRDYVCCLSSIHAEVRNMQSAKIAASEELYATHTKGFSAAFPAEPTLRGLVAAEITGSERTNEISLYPGFIDRRRKLLAKNHRFSNLEKRFVTGQVDQPDA